MAEYVDFPMLFFYDDDSDTPQKCRDRRRRRIELRRCAFAAASNVVEGNGIQSPEAELTGCDAVVEVKAEEAVPEYGFLSLAGKRRDMEDAVSVQINLCSPEICRLQPVHFFAVFDGHGGPHVAVMCREMMHLILKDELSRVKSTRGCSRMGAIGGNLAGSAKIREEDGSREEDEVVGWWKSVFRRVFSRMDEAVLSSSSAFGNSEFAMSGSTAVVAVITPRHIVVANCGDSRAVLCRGGQLVPLSFDHKPDRPDELARIQAAGGRVIDAKGTRVQGILAMSRSIGDKFLKRFVTAEPEVTITRRDTKDECLILASDGLWDVVSSELACEIARSSLEEGRVEDEQSESCYSSNPSMLVASFLTRLALGRESCDNISTIVVDVKRT